mmetsp:Transcript_26370/g.91699  ORF Transcript_26370/g.91699 Transcript_26370/m.91699 type:complete len:259 (+) Transcript_26370:357-1133(+)
MLQPRRVHVDGLLPDVGRQHRRPLPVLHGVLREPHDEPVLPLPLHVHAVPDGEAEHPLPGAAHLRRGRQRRAAVGRAPHALQDHPLRVVHRAQLPARRAQDRRLREQGAALHHRPPRLRGAVVDRAVGRGQHGLPRPHIVVRGHHGHVARLRAPHALAQHPHAAHVLADAADPVHVVGPLQDGVPQHARQAHVAHAAPLLPAHRRHGLPEGGWVPAEHGAGARGRRRRRRRRWGRPHVAVFHHVRHARVRAARDGAAA